MSDEVLIQEIRTAMHAAVEDVEVPAGLLATVSVARARSRPGLGWLMPALAVGVAALVAVVAVTSLDHRASAGRGATATPVGARGLASRLAVLRRPQRPADVLPRWAVREIGSLTHQAPVIARLSRVVGSVNLGQNGRAHAYLIVQRVRRLGDVASIAFVGPFREEAAINGPTVAAGGDEVAATSHGLTGGPGHVGDLWGAFNGIVPDGVQRVKWVFTRVGTSSGLPAVTLWPRLRGNVAIGQLPFRWQVYLSSAVWYGAGGRVLRSFGTPGRVSPGTRKLKVAFEASVHDPVAPILRQHFGVLRSISRRLRSGASLDSLRSLIEPNPLDLNVSKARSITYSPTPAKLLVVPGTQGIALRSSGPIVSQGEAGTEGALAGQLINPGPRVSGTRTIVGLVPDGNRTVRVPLPGGGMRSAPVLDNVFAITVPAGATTVVLKNAAGHVVRIRFA